LGRAFANAISSFTERAGIDGCTTRRFAMEANSRMGELALDIPLE
jgi:hypothetical protein